MKENRIDISYGNRLNEQIAKVKKMKKQLEGEEEA